MPKWNDLAQLYEADGSIPEGFDIGGEIGELVDEALQESFTQEEIGQIVDEARGEGADGFVARLADAIEERADIRLEDEVSVDSENITTSSPIEDKFADYEEAKAGFNAVSDKYLFRNVFVSGAKLEMDIEAYRAGMPGANGKAITGGDIAMDVINLLRGNIFESVLEVAIRDYFDERYPGVELETDYIEAVNTADQPEQEIAAPLMDERGLVRDDGYIYNVSEFKEAGIDLEMARKDNPTYGQYMGADMTREPRERDGMKTWDIGRYENRSIVSEGKVERLGIPPMRLVELHDNHYLVDPFGKVLAANTESNPNSVLEVGTHLSNLDVSGYRGNAEKFEALASNQGIDVESLKAEVSNGAKEAYVEQVSSRMEGHIQHLNTTALPEARGILDDYKADLKVIEQKENSLLAEKQDILSKAEVSPGEQARITQIDNELERVGDYKESLERVVDRIDSHITDMEKNVEQYREVKDKLEVADGDPDGRFNVVADLERTAAGRADSVSYMDGIKDKEIGEYASELRAAIDETLDVENEENDGAAIVSKEEGDTQGTSTQDSVSEDVTGPEEKKGDAIDPGQNSDSAVESDTAGNRHDDVSSDKEKPIDAGRHDNPDAKSQIDLETLSDSPAKKRDGVEDNSNLDSGLEAGTAQEASADMRETTQDGQEEAVISEMKNDEADPTELSDTHPEEVKQISAGEHKASPARKDDATIVAEAEAQMENANVSSDTHGDMKEKQHIPGDAKQDGNEIDKDDKERLYEDVIDAFESFLNNDTYNFSEDFLEQLSPDDSAVLVSGDMMYIAFAEVYGNMESVDTTEGASFGDLMYEVATFHDGPMLQNLDDLLDSLRANGVDNTEVEILMGLSADDMVMQITEEINLRADDDNHYIKLGEEAFLLTSDGVYNAMDGTESDPQQLVDRTVDYIDQNFGGDLSASAQEQLAGVDSGTSLEDTINLVDQFFAGFADVANNTLTDIASTSPDVDAQVDNGAESMTRDMHLQEQERMQDHAEGVMEADGFGDVPDNEYQDSFDENDVDTDAVGW